PSMMASTSPHRCAGPRHEIDRHYGKAVWPLDGSCDLASAESLQEPKNPAHHLLALSLRLRCRASRAGTFPILRPNQKLRVPQTAADTWHGRQPHLRDLEIYAAALF